MEDYEVGDDPTGDRSQKPTGLSWVTVIGFKYQKVIIKTVIM